ncbi:hypothetical protein DENSPDRAFT_795625 [Dentipellis sp. KUC8613]|nr:hypothetical protein DENSPDRAFT_795625 [Dentipellis sp. KUC8613]
MRPFLLLVTGILAVLGPSTGRRVLEREFVALSGPSLSTLAASSDPSTNLDASNPSSHLSKILIPRAPDTSNNTLVRNYLVETLRALDWHVEEDSFIDNTPYGPKNFTNVIATKDPDAPHRVALAAHFDSKFFAASPLNQFVGATDSAAPCALMLDLAESLNPLLNARAAVADDPFSDYEIDADVADTTLQLIFFDGEEAFKDWTDTDSIYGARHLATKWQNTYLPPHPKRRLLASHGAHTPLSTLDHLILLDLLGAPRPRVRSYFPDTAWLFDALVSAERRLGDAGLLMPSADGNKEGEKGLKGPGEGAGHEGSFFAQRTGHEGTLGYIGDDHVPFLRAGVSILHVIAEPFPHVWHTLADDASALDLPTLRRWNLILRVFFAEYLGLRPDELSTREADPTPSEGAEAAAVRRSASEL